MFNRAIKKNCFNCRHSGMSYSCLIAKGLPVKWCYKQSSKIFDEKAECPLCSYSLKALIFGDQSKDSAILYGGCISPDRPSKSFINETSHRSTYNRKKSYSAKSHSKDGFTEEELSSFSKDIKDSMRKGTN